MAYQINDDIVNLGDLKSDLYTSQQKKRYKGLMLNMFYIDKKMDKNRVI